jgi:Domain of unknown function (DUF4352)
MTMHKKPTQHKKSALGGMRLPDLAQHVTSRQLGLLSVLMLVIVLGSVMWATSLPGVVSHLPERRAFQSGQAIRMPHYTMQVDALKRQHTPLMMPIADTDSFLVVNIRITNTSTERLDFFPEPSTHLRDSHGLSYKMAPTRLTQPLQPGSIMNGESIDGQVSYLIPLTEEHPVLYIGSQWPGESVTVRL